MEVLQTAYFWVFNYNFQPFFFFFFFSFIHFFFFLGEFGSLKGHCPPMFSALDPRLFAETVWVYDEEKEKKLEKEREGELEEVEKGKEKEGKGKEREEEKGDKGKEKEEKVIEVEKEKEDKKEKEEKEEKDKPQKRIFGMSFRTDTGEVRFYTNNVLVFSSGYRTIRRNVSVCSSSLDITILSFF